jgi:hypothetical protein
VDETDAFGKDEKGQRITNQDLPPARQAYGCAAELGSANVECEERSLDARSHLPGRISTLINLGQSLNSWRIPVDCWATKPDEAQSCGDVNFYP